MPKKISEPPEPIGEFVRAVNESDRAGFLRTFARDATVRDIGKEFSGHDAIKQWSDSEIFDVHCRFEVVDLAERDGEIVVTAKVDGTFDKTGLPDPLLFELSFALRGDKISAFSSRLTNA